MERHDARIMRRRFYQGHVCILLLIISGMLHLGGCIQRGRNSPMMELYTLEYPSPVFSGMPLLEQTIKVERFSVAKAYNTQSIVFRPEPYKLDVYSRNNWIVNPGFMICDYLVRDLRNSGLFSGIFSYRDYEEARFVLEGSLEEILETDEGDGRSALLSISVSLLDLSRSGMPKRLMYQKKYRSSEPLGEQTVGGLVKAMSTCMAKLSPLIVRDAYAAISALGSGKD
jgi:cholesterol transport system auxiliary component